MILQRKKTKFNALKFCRVHFNQSIILIGPAKLHN